MSVHKANSKYEELNQSCRGSSQSGLMKAVSTQHSAEISERPDTTKVLQGCVVIFGQGITASILPNNVNMWDDFTELANLRHSSWSVFRRPDRIQPRLRRQAKGQLYLHVSYQDLYHAGPENRQLIASVQYGKQISQCQDVSQSSRQEGGERGRENKTKNRSYFPGLSRKPSSCTTLSSGLHISQVLQLTRSPDA